MQEISVNNVSLLRVSGALAIHTAGKLETAAKGPRTGMPVAGVLLNRHVIGHYSECLQMIQEKGGETLRDTSGAYVAAVWNNFADNRPTCTRELVSGRLVMKGWKEVSGLLGGSGGEKWMEKVAGAATAGGT